MAIDLSNSRGSIKEIADELVISKCLLSKWKQRATECKQVSSVLTEDQKLQKELKNAQTERDILKYPKM
jgi:transposase